MENTQTQRQMHFILHISYTLYRLQYLCLLFTRDLKFILQKSGQYVTVAQSTFAIEISSYFLQIVHHKTAERRRVIIICYMSPSFTSRTRVYLVVETIDTCYEDSQFTRKFRACKRHREPSRTRTCERVHHPSFVQTYTCPENRPGLKLRHSRE